MLSKEKSSAIPVLVSLLISSIAFISLWQLKDTPLRELAVTVALWFSIGIFLAFLLYFIVSCVLLMFKKSIWLAGMPTAILVYFGIMIMSLSYFQEIWSIIERDIWNPNIVALGIAVFALGIAFFPRYKPPSPEDILEELKIHADNLGNKIANFSEMQNNLENISGLVLKESQKFLDNLSEILEKGGKSY